MELNTGDIIGIIVMGVPLVMGLLILWIYILKCLIEVIKSALDELF